MFLSYHHCHWWLIAWTEICPIEWIRTRTWHHVWIDPARVAQVHIKWEKVENKLGRDVCWDGTGIPQMGTSICPRCFWRILSFSIKINFIKYKTMWFFLNAFVWLLGEMKQVKTNFSRLAISQPGLQLLLSLEIWLTWLK